MRDGGYLCDPASSRILLAGAGLVCPAGELAMALAPRTLVAFVGFTLLNNALLGIAWAAVAAVIFTALNRNGSGRIGALLGSLCNVPTVLMTIVLGAPEARYGVAGMMVIEAIFGIISAGAYGLFAWRLGRHESSPHRAIEVVRC